MFQILVDLINYDYVIAELLAAFFLTAIGWFALLYSPEWHCCIMPFSRIVPVEDESWVFRRNIFGAVRRFRAYRIAPFEQSVAGRHFLSKGKSGIPDFFFLEFIPIIVVVSDYDCKAAVASFKTLFQYFNASDIFPVTIHPEICSTMCLNKS